MLATDEVLSCYILKRSFTDLHIRNALILWTSSLAWTGF